jgi:hypothetical protein
MMFSERPTLYARTRALYRLLNMHKHELLSRQQWEALMWLKSLVDKRVCGADAQVITGTSLQAESRTQTDLGFLDVLAIYCTVRLFSKSGELVLTYVSHQLVTNCFSIHPAEEGMLGTSLDLVTSLINHSCDPNALVVFEGSSLRLRSIRKLCAGDEITQCYTDVDMDVLIRREALRTEFFFDCHCERNGLLHE